jgi:hypothetical protein
MGHMVRLFTVGCPWSSIDAVDGRSGRWLQLLVEEPGHT